MLVKVLVTALSTQVRKLPQRLRQSLTSRHGTRGPQDLPLATDTQVYFCDPQSPWQRGTNENTNRLLRQYFPRGTDLSAHSQSLTGLRIESATEKDLGICNSGEQLQASVASIG